MIIDDTRRQLLLDDIDPLEINEFKVLKRDGRLVTFQPNRIHCAIVKAFQADLGLLPEEPLDPYRSEACHKLTDAVVKEVLARAVRGEQLEIELIQDAVEHQLMAHSHYAVARRYILYREARKRARLLRGEPRAACLKPLNVKLPDGSSEPLDPQKVRRTLVRACDGLEDHCGWQEVADEVLQSLYNGVTPSEIERALLDATRRRMDQEPVYGFMAARLLLKRIYREVWQKSVAAYEFDSMYRNAFKAYIVRGVEQDRLNPELMRFDLDKMASGLAMERDTHFNYSDLQSVYDHFLFRRDNGRIETPQYFFMRVAMGLALQEGDLKNERALDFYDVLSTFRFMPATSILFQAGTPVHQETRAGSAQETAIINQGAIKLVHHLKDGKLDVVALRQTIRTAIRMLDNVIDIYTYPTEEMRVANQSQRPVGLGFTGFSEALRALRIAAQSEAAARFADRAREVLAYHTVLASSELARERGAFESYHSSPWNQGRLPADAREGTARLDWKPVKESIRAYGMRNNNGLMFVSAEAPSPVCDTAPPGGSHTENSSLLMEREIIQPIRPYKKESPNSVSAVCRTER